MVPAHDRGHSKRDLVTVDPQIPDRVCRIGQDGGVVMQDADIEAPADEFGHPRIVWTSKGRGTTLSWQRSEGHTRGRRDDARNAHNACTQWKIGWIVRAAQARDRLCGTVLGSRLVDKVDGESARLFIDQLSRGFTRQLVWRYRAVPLAKS